MEWIEFNNIVDIISGYAIPSSDMKEEGIPIIKITNIQENGTLDLDNTSKYCKPITPQLEKFILKDKDIVVCMTGATIGKVARISKVDKEYLVNQRVCIVRAKNTELQDYVYHVLSLPSFRKYVETVGYGAAQPNISTKGIGKFKFSAESSFLTQCKIASILSSYDSLIENNTKRIRLLEQMAENLYKEWFVRFRFPGHENTEFVDGLPKGWKKDKLESICKFERGKNITSGEMKEGNIPVIAAGVAPSGFHNQANVHGTSITMSSSGANAGFIAIHYGDIWAADCSYISETSTKNIFYIYQLLDNLRVVITNMQRGAAQPHVYAKDINNLKICIPSKELRKAANDRLSAIHKQIYYLQQQSALLTRQRDLLLPRLMSGKLEVKTIKE